MKYTQHLLQPLKLATLEASLRHDEEIACTNATVIVDQEGNVTGWIDNDKPFCVIDTEG